MSDGAEVGKAYIDITPELNKAGVKKFERNLKAHLQAMAKEADKSLKASQQDLMGNFTKQMDAFQKGKAKGVFEQHRQEMQSWQKLQKQREQSIAAEQKDQQRRLNELSQWYKKKQALEKADALEAKKAADQFIADQRKKDAYLRARLSGATPEKAAGFATGRLPTNEKDMSAALSALTAKSKVAGSSVARAFDSASHTLSQLSTRIGLASFQLQLLGGFATTFLTGPAVLGLGMLARDGLKFAVNIDYARASMKSLLGPATDVEKILADIQKMAIESPLFNTEDAIGYAQKLAAVGVKGNDLYKTMQALSNIMMTQGVAGPERANLAMLAYTQILSKGAIGMDDLRQQFAEHVPGGMKIFEEAARRLGYKSIAELSDAMKDGKVSAADLNKAIIAIGNSPKYLQGATNAAQTLGGVWQSFTEEMQSKIGMAFDKNRAAIIAAINGIRPVVMGFIDGLVKRIPLMIEWLGRIVAKAQDLKAKWDALSPAQQEVIRHLTLIAIGAGPAAIAIGILGTAVSGAANSISLALKSLSLVGGALTALGGWVMAAIAAIGALVVAVGIMYTRSEGMRKAVLKVLNLIKDFIATVFLPVVDLLIGSIQSLGHTLEGMGLKSEHLAYVLLVLATPIAALTVAFAALAVVVKAVQFTILVLMTVAQGFLQTLGYVILGFGKFYELLSKLPGASDGFKKSMADTAKSANETGHKLIDMMDVSGEWKRLTEANSGATDEWQSKLNNLDLTTTGLSGVFGGFNGILDQTISKQFSLTDAINGARAAMQSQASAARSMTDASDAYNQSMIGLKESIKANGKTLNEHTQQGQSNRAALKSATQASYEMMLQDIRSGVPMDQAIKRHRERTEALKKEFGKNKETRGEAQKLIDTYGKVPKDVNTLLKLLGWDGTSQKLQQILAAQKVAANPGMSYDKALYAERKAWQVRNYATGGQIRGPGGPTADKIPIMASDQEYMIRAFAANKLGKPILDYINKTGQLPVQQYAKGGSVTWPFDIDISKTKFPELIGGSPSGGAMGWQKMMAILHTRFPGLPLISGYRPGAMTSTGNRSYHALGRAVDLPPRWDVFNWISQNYGRGTKELIFTPAGGRQIKNGQNHVFTGGTIQEDHYNHVHWAYDNGGSIAPNQPFINKTGANELALNAAQGKALEQKIRNSDRPVNVTVYVDGVKRDAEIVFDEKAEQLIQALGGV